MRSLLVSISAVALLASPLAYAQEQSPAVEAPASQAEPQKQDSAETYRQLNLFGDVFERVRAQYVDPVTDEKLMQYAINGMLSSLDPHSAYLDEKDFGDMRIQTKGEFGGLGIEVTMEDGLVKVVSPIDDTPAFKAGIKTGDYITHLDGKPIIGMSLSEAVDAMRGKVGAPVELTVRREGIAEPLKLKIVRDIIRIQSVRSRVEGNGTVGYIRITTFNQNTEEGLKNAVEKIKKETGANLIGYILDLRNNPGGLLDQAIAVSDAFLDKGEIVSTRGRDEKDIKRDNATPGDITNGLPIAILINGGSASASEIVSGALQDHRRAIVMGTRSFGKGSVQTVIPLPGHGAMRLTTARYYTPSGRSIQAKGIEPDILVEQAKLEKISESSFHEEDLRGALINTDKSNADKKENSAQPQPDASVKPNGSTEKTAEEKSKEAAAEDYQLNRAVDLLRGLALYERKEQ
jgi:carboxyl-terminal processing protease